MTSVSLQPEDRLQTIRVLTFNILSADHANWERRRQVARSGLRAIRPDIVALQETTPGIRMPGRRSARPMLATRSHR